MMAGQEQVTNVAGLGWDLDFECPDCQSLLTLYYDLATGRKYMCENCDQEVSLFDLDSDDGGSSDNNIRAERG